MHLHVLHYDFSLFPYLEFLNLTRINMSNGRNTADDDPCSPPIRISLQLLNLNGI